MLSILDVLERAETGPICEGKDWDTIIIPAKISEKLKEHGLSNAYDSGNPIPSDDSLADDFWKAGFDLARDVGLLCLTTRRAIKFSEEELKACLRGLPTEVGYGSHEDMVLVRHRNVEDRRPPVCRYGPMGIDLEEDLFIPIEMSILQYKVIDMLEQGQVRTICGRERRAGTPTDILGSARRLQLHREATELAGRPGLWWDEPEHCNIISELKTSYDILGRVTWQWRHGITDLLTNVPRSIGHSTIGGYAGGTEGAVVSCIAAAILARLAYLAKISNNEILDVRYLGDTSPESLWANSVLSQAISRNSMILHSGTGTVQAAGPCTEMLLQEVAISAMKDAVNGNSEATGVRPSGGRYINHASALESKFAAEVAKSATGMKRADANEIAKKLLARYESKLKNPPKGKSFLECFDLKTLAPSEEWLKIYHQVWKDIEDLGVPINIT